MADQILHTGTDTTSWHLAVVHDIPSALLNKGSQEYLNGMHRLIHHQEEREWDEDDD